MTNYSYTNPSYTFTETFTGGDEVQIATFFPFSYEKMDAYVDDVNSSEWATKTVLGQSEQARDIDLLTITNTAVPVGEKKVIYIIGRQHSAETSSSHMLEGMIDFLISDDLWAEGFRDHYIWYIAPMINPDGVYLGNSRADSSGNDLNRDWGNSDSNEINLVRANIQSVDTAHSVDMFIDWHSQMNDDRWYNFVYSPSGNTFFSILSTWTDFGSQSEGSSTSCEPDSCTARAWATSEGLFMFGFEPTPHLYTWTEESLNEQGKLTAFAINEYFGMFPPSTVLLDDGFEDSTFDINWNDNGATNWLRNISYVHSGVASARAQGSNYSEGPITTDDLDASDAISIKIDLWFRNSGADSGEVILYCYNGSEYIEIADFFDLGPPSEWVHYTETITDSQFFKSNFRIRADADMSSSSEYFRLDDVLITKQTCNGYALTMDVNAPDGGTTDPPVGAYCYTGNELVNISATAYAGCQFDYWQGDVNDINSATTTVLMDEDQEVIAHFLPVIPEGLLADNEIGASSNSDDLILNSAGQDWYESRNDVPALLTLDESDVGGNNTKKAALKNYSISNNVYMTQEFKQSQSSTFDISYEIYIDKIADDSTYDRTAFVFLGDDSEGTNGPVSTSTERFAFLCFYDSTPGDSGDDLEIRAREYNTPAQPWAETSTWTQVASGLSYDRWYTIKIIADIAEGVYDVYVDGVLEANDVSKYEDYSSASVTHIAFSAGSSAKGDFYVDDVISPAYDADNCSAANLDGSDPVNFNDLAILAIHWAETGWDIVGDIDKNRVVNFNDLDRLRDQWLTNCNQ